MACFKTARRRESGGWVHMEVITAGLTFRPPLRLEEQHTTHTFALVLCPVQDRTLFSQEALSRKDFRQAVAGGTVSQSQLGRRTLMDGSRRCARAWLQRLSRGVVQW